MDALQPVSLREASSVFENTAEDISEKTALVGRVALVVILSLGFVAAAVFTGGAAVAAPGVGLLATYSILCIGSVIGAVGTGFVANSYGMFNEKSSEASPCGFMVISLFIPLYMAGKIIWEFFPCILICLALENTRL